jgi:hypothetical protein
MSVLRSHGDAALDAKLDVLQAAEVVVIVQIWMLLLCGIYILFFSPSYIHRHMWICPYAIPKGVRDWIPERPSHWLHFFVIPTVGKLMEEPICDPATPYPQQQPQRRRFYSYSSSIVVIQVARRRTWSVPPSSNQQSIQYQRSHHGSSSF